MSQAVAFQVSVHKVQGLNLRGISFPGYFMVLLILSTQIPQRKCGLLPPWYLHLVAGAWYLHLVAGVFSRVTGLPRTSDLDRNAGGIRTIGRATPCWTGVRRGPDKERYPGPPSWGFGVRVKSSPHQNDTKRGKLRPEYGPKGHKGRGIIVINNSIPYYLCADTRA